MTDGPRSGNVPGMLPDPPEDVRPRSAGAEYVETIKGLMADVEDLPADLAKLIRGWFPHIRDEGPRAAPVTGMVIGCLRGVTEKQRAADHGDGEVDGFGLAALRGFLRRFNPPDNPRS